MKKFFRFFTQTRRLNLQNLKKRSRLQISGVRICKTHPCIEACLAAIVALVISPLIELLPQRLCLPRAKLGLELGVELVEVGRFDLEQLAEVPKVAEYGLEGRRVAELIEHLVGQRHVRRGHLLTAVLVIHPARRPLIRLTRWGSRSCSCCYCYCYTLVSRGVSLCHYLKRVHILCG